MSDHPAGRPTGGRRIGRRVALLALSLMLLPVGLAVGLFPLLAGSPFDAVEGIDPADVQTLRVFVLNRREFDGGDDVGPFHARPDDAARLLEPLRGLTPLVGPPADARGPWLGEYRIGLKGGRRGTVRFYWVRRPVAGQADGPTALAGPAVLYGRPELVPGAFGLRVQAGGKWYDGGQPLELIAAAVAASKHGTPAAR